jgi:hypothetical protein
VSKVALGLKTWVRKVPKIILLIFGIQDVIEIAASFNGPLRNRSARKYKHCLPFRGSEPQIKQDIPFAIKSVEALLKLRRKIR